MEHFTKLINKYQGPGLYFYRGVLYLQLKEYDKALADVNKALRIDGDMLQALRVKGIIYLQQEKFDDAIRIFEQLKRRSDDKVEATLQIAFATSRKGLYKKAVEMLDKELEANPESTDIMRSRADMELSYGHWAEAIDWYGRVLAKDPNDSGVLNNYSWLLSTCPVDSIRNGEKALEYGLLAAEKTFYAAPHILSTLAAAYAELGDFENARKWSAKAVEIGEKEKYESLDSLKNEQKSYLENKPWRETAEIIQEIEEPAETPAE
ncbi:MAG: tetratricopeptide repeat protein [Thermoguttaceae bacterium]|nr:tetratricopeptide repeat protein [Thermoguttaceae bacterium]